MKFLLLTRRSPFQFYCANVLFERGLLSEVLLEDGASFPPPSSLARLRNAVSQLSHPLRAARLALNKLAYRQYFGRRAYHERRVLGRSCERLDPALPSASFRSFNESEAAERIRTSGADAVLVFGTSLLKPPVFASSKAPFINMHWGWSPDYRGEGIVSALALGGAAHLGVTVHLLDAGVDSGDILHRERCDIDPEDNFYSIGLKLTKTGVELFARVLENVRAGERLSGDKQSLAGGRVYSSKYMREHPELYPQAWARLAQERRRHAASQARA